MTIIALMLVHERSDAPSMLGVPYRKAWGNAVTASGQFFVEVIKHEIA